MTIWECRKSDPDQVNALAQELNLSPTMARVLVHRKITDAKSAESFFKSDLATIHSPDLLQDMPKAVQRLAAAILNKQKICIYGDYDVDGAVSTTMLVAFLRELDAIVDFYIPNRLLEGYSLNKIAVDRMAAQGTQLVVTVDNGIMAHESIEYASALGLDVIVTDHHQVGDSLPKAVAVVNPQRRDCGYPFKGICGAGVAFKLMMALRQYLRAQEFFKNHTEPNLKSYFDLLCIPTVCDVVPLTGENRIFVKEGLRHIVHSKRIGIQALIKVCQLDDKNITAHDLGFKLGPRINACGRLEDASLGVRLLLSNDPVEALKLATRLDELNRERRDIEKDMTADALQLLTTIDLNDTLGLVVFAPDWHVGVVGIVASRLVEKTHRPVFVLAQTEQGYIKGSGRSVTGVSLISALQDCSAGLVAFGGHEAAAGVTLTHEQLPQFIKNFDAAVKKQMSSEMLTRKILVDEELNLNAIDERLLTELEKLEPHGAANAKPLFAARAVPVKSRRVVGNQHLKLSLGGDKIIEAIAFGAAADKLASADEVGVIFGLEFNHYNGTKKIQMVVKSFF